MQYSRIPGNHVEKHRGVIRHFMILRKKRHIFIEAGGPVIVVPR
ncbi:MAG: hypothetical protein BWY20_01535 [Spirochaetes bacterium ADurb.Bin215]|nr:MAG: hypothetical protein BWY20_01535 [Spirochaetes bacterium ADurb.Bin215]